MFCGNERPKLGGGGGGGGGVQICCKYESATLCIVRYTYLFLSYFFLSSNSYNKLPTVQAYKVSSFTEGVSFIEGA